MLNQTPVARMCAWRMITLSWPDDAVNGIIAHLVNGRAILEAGIIMCKDYIITLPGLVAGIIGTLRIETLLSAMICVHHRPLVIFGKSLFVKENDNALSDCFFSFLFFFFVIFYCN